MKKERGWFGPVSLLSLMSSTGLLKHPVYFPESTHHPKAAVGYSLSLEREPGGQKGASLTLRRWVFKIPLMVSGHLMGLARDTHCGVRMLLRCCGKNGREWGSMGKLWGPQLQGDFFRLLGNQIGWLRLSWRSSSVGNKVSHVLSWPQP